MSYKNSKQPDGQDISRHLETGLTEETPAKPAEPEKPSTTVAEQVTPTVRPVPPGLFRCPVCNEYRGFLDIDNQSVHSRCKGDFLTVQCICDGILCPRCKINRIHRPISNVWSERGGFGHIPYFAAMGPCDECYAKREAEYADKNAKTEKKEGSR